LNGRESLRFLDLNQNSESVSKISAYLLGNSHFAESQSGEWFDVDCAAGIAVATSPTVSAKDAFLIFFSAAQRTRTMPACWVR
jgi:hypothetical protein